MNTQRGFTLIEVSIVLLIIAFTLGSIMIPLGTSLEQKAINDTKQQIADIKAAIINFTIANRRMPCPDTTTGNNRDGLENTDGLGACSSELGSIPHVALNIPHRQDAWGQPFIYRVTGTFADTPATGPGTPCNITTNINVSIAMCSAADADITVNDYDLLNAIQIPAATNISGIIISTGKPTSSDSATEVENINNNPIYVKMGYSDRNSTMPFNDIVVWISPNELIGHLIQAQILP